MLCNQIDIQTLVTYVTDGTGIDFIRPDMLLVILSNF